MIEQKDDVILETGDNIVINSDIQIAESSNASLSVNSEASNEKLDEPKRGRIIKNNRRHQIMASLIITLGAFICGTTTGWSAPGIPSIRDRKDKDGIILSEYAQSWIGAIPDLAGACSIPFAWLAISKLGRQRTILLSAIPSLCGYVLLACSKYVWMILLGQAINEFVAGFFTMIAPIYISETVEKDLRGVLGTSFSVLMSSGILFSYVVGALTNWIWLSVVCSILPVVMFFLVLLVPQTPTYLLLHGKTNEARASLKWLRRDSSALSTIEMEFIELQEKVSADSKKRRVSVYDIKQKSYIKPFAIACGLMTFQQLIGIAAVHAYSVDIFRNAGSDISPNICSIIIACVDVASVCCSALLADRAGRRILFFISNVGVISSLILLGLSFFLKFKNSNATPEGMGWLPLASLIIYMISYNLFIGPGPYLIMSEILPPRVDGVFSALALFLCYFTGFVVTITFKNLTDLLQDFGYYWLFAGFGILAFFFGFFFLPETKGKTLEQIQLMFAK